MNVFPCLLERTHACRFLFLLVYQPWKLVAASKETKPLCFSTSFSSFFLPLIPPKMVLTPKGDYLKQIETASIIKSSYSGSKSTRTVLFLFSIKGLQFWWHLLFTSYCDRLQNLGSFYMIKSYSRVFLFFFVFFVFVCLFVFCFCFCIQIK